MDEFLSFSQVKKEYHGTLKGYVIGFFSSLILTLISFSLVVFELLQGKAIVYTLITLAVFQAIIQLRFFLHLGQEDKPRWESMIFGFTLMILLAYVIGTLWVMYDLNFRMMPDMTMMDMKHD